MVTTNKNTESIDTEMDIIMDTAMGIGMDLTIETKYEAPSINKINQRANLYLVAEEPHK